MIEDYADLNIILHNMKKYYQLKIKFFNSTLLCFVFFSFFISSARAATIEKTELDLNKKIKITGGCDGGVLNVQIFSTTSSQPFYTAGADCNENKFEFKDDLGYWKIPDGDYSVAVTDKDENSHSSAATFKIQSVVPPASDANIVEPIADNNAATIEITNQEEAPDQTAAPENPPEGLFAQIINFLVEWFKNAIVIIKELVVEKVSTPELCLGQTCIMEDQLKDLLGGKQKIEVSAPEPEIQPPTPSSVSDVTTTITN